jgi:hypothetical protein
MFTEYNLGGVLKNIWLGSLAVAVTIIVAASATSVAAKGRRDVHAPIFVSGPRVQSVITPYYFGYYAGHYSYNSPGPIFYRLDYRDQHNSCWLWRYNYLIWVC